MRKRRTFTPEFKAKVSLEALKERESITELAKRFELHPNQINAWKKEFLSNSSKVFTGSSNPENDTSDKKVEKLYETIGQQKVEIDFLKKALS